ncbi:MAG: S-methyl-5-thioribose kinase [Gammaproteobacteria bacterium]
MNDQAAAPKPGADSALAAPEGYRAHDTTTLAAYLESLPGAAAILGGSRDDWRVEEVGDGNLNLVFIVRGPSGGLAVKQALPYVRLVGESWPLPLSRAYYEHMALAEHALRAPGLVPEIIHFDPALSLIAMELLEPHIIMRRGMIEAVRYPHFAVALATFMARTLFFTSDLYLSADEKKKRAAAFSGNTALCKITEDLIFTEPYMIADNNRWTSPQLDDDARAIREDASLKVAISELKCRFMSDAQALLHGDLHTGSIMVTATDTRVIDPEFAFFGPMGFDTGALIANLLINYYSQDGHASADDPRDAYQNWVLEQIEAVWAEFDAQFRALMNEQRRGDAYPAPLFEGDAVAWADAQNRYLRRLFADTLGFAGAKMVRRILGLAHNIDLEWIEDPDRRAVCERRCLKLARDLMVNREHYAAMPDIVERARAIRAG